MKKKFTGNANITILYVIISFQALYKYLLLLLYVCRSATNTSAAYNRLVCG